MSDVSSEVCRGAGGGFSEGQERGPHCAGIQWSKEKLRGPAVLGTGYYVSTVGKDEQAVRQYIREQEVTDRQLDLDE